MANITDGLSSHLHPLLAFYSIIPAIMNLTETQETAGTVTTPVTQTASPTGGTVSLVSSSSVPSLLRTAGDMIQSVTPTGTSDEMTTTQMTNFLDFTTLTSELLDTSEGHWDDELTTMTRDATPDLTGSTNMWTASSMISDLVTTTLEPDIITTAVTHTTSTKSHLLTTGSPDTRMIVAVTDEPYTWTASATASDLLSSVTTDLLNNITTSQELNLTEISTTMSPMMSGDSAIGPDFWGLFSIVTDLLDASLTHNNNKVIRTTTTNLTATGECVCECVTNGALTSHLLLGIQVCIIVIVALLVIIIVLWLLLKRSQNKIKKAVSDESLFIRPTQKPQTQTKRRTAPGIPTPFVAGDHPPVVSSMYGATGRSGVKDGESSRSHLWINSQANWDE